MAVAFRSIDGNSIGTQSTHTVTAPTGITDGDILIWGTNQDDGGGSTTITYPSGFTEIYDSGAGNHRFQCAWKRASSESGDYVATLASAKWSQSYLLCYSGAYATGDPQDATAVTNSGNDASPVGASISPANSGSMLIELVSQVGANTGHTAPSGMTERYDTSNLSANDELLSSSGATGTRTGSGQNNSWITVMIVLRAAAGGGTTTRRYSLSLTGVG